MSTTPFDESKFNRSAVTGKFEDKPEQGFEGEFTDEPADLGATPDAARAAHAESERRAQIESEQRARIASLTPTERLVVAGDPFTHPRALTRIYLNADARGDANLNDALARNENTPPEVKSAILRRGPGVLSDTGRHLMKTLRNVDFETGYEPYTDTHRDVRDQIVDGPSEGSAFRTGDLMDSGLLHADDVKQALRGADPALRARLDAVDWPSRFPNLTREVVGEALEAGLTSVASHPRLTPGMQAQCVAHSATAARDIVSNLNADRQVLTDLARNSLRSEDPEYAHVADLAMERLVTGRIR